MLKTNLKTNETTSLTEIVLSARTGADLELLLPMLAHLSRKNPDRWFTWINPKDVDKQLLKDFEFALDNVRVIYSRNEDEILWLMWDALANGTSGSVVAEIGAISENSRKELEQAALLGNCRGLLIRNH